MEPQSIFPAVEWHKELDSTNNEAKRRLESIDNLSIIAAVHQSAGRGRGSHSWITRPGENLTFSLVLQFGEGGQAPLPAAEAVRITHFITVSLCDFLISEGVEPRIKWPNDLWAGDRKVCGILIENTFEGGGVRSSIIGVGLNLNQTEFDPRLPNPTSVGILTGRRYDIYAAMDTLYKIFCRRAEQLDSEGGRERLELEFSERMFVLDKGSQGKLQQSIDNFEATKSL